MNDKDTAVEWKPEDKPGTPTQHEYMLAGAEMPRVAVKETPKPRLLDVPLATEGASILALPPGWTTAGLESLLKAHEAAQLAPTRRRGVYIAGDVDSMLRWMDAHCADASPVFAMGADGIAREWRMPNLVLLGIGNYSYGLTNPHWHDFYSAYRFPVTEAWSGWAASSGEWMTQGEFSEFVEKHSYEFSEPSRGEVISEAVTRMIESLGGTKSVGTPAKMYEVANGVKLMVSEQVEVELDRATGEQTLKFAETHTGKGGRPVGIPRFFYVRLPIFFGEKESLVGVLLRYRNQGGGRVQWSYELFAPELLVQDAFNKACDVVRAADRTLFLGTPDKAGGMWVNNFDKY